MLFVAIMSVIILIVITHNDIVTNVVMLNVGAPKKDLFTCTADERGCTSGNKCNKTFTQTETLFKLRIKVLEYHDFLDDVF